MEQLSLNLSLTQNKALNQDATTALRSLGLVQGQTYDVALSLYSGTSGVSPALSDFLFLIRDQNAANIVSATGINPAGSGYQFLLPVTSPAFSPSSRYKGYFSFSANGNLEIIEPFPISVSITAGNGQSVGYVSSLNGLTSDVMISGVGTLSVSQSGQNIIISENGNSYATTAALTGLSGVLQAEINAGGGGTPANVVFTSGTQTISGAKTFATESFFPSGASGVFFGNGGVLQNVVNTTGTQTINGAKTFSSEAVFQNGIQPGTLYNSSQSPVIDIDGGSPLTLNGVWTLNGYPLAMSLRSYATLTKLTPATSAVITASASWGNANEGDTISVTVDGDTVVFEFSFVGNSSEGISVPITSGDDDTTAVSFASALNSVFGSGGNNTASLGTFGNSVSLDTVATGSSANVSISGSGGYGTINYNSTGVDEIPAQDLEQLVAGFNGLSGATVFITEIYAYCDGGTGSSWANCDIQIGYWDGSTWTNIFTIPQAQIVTDTSLTLPTAITIDVNALNSAPASATWYAGLPNTPIYARTSSGGTPADETEGGNVTVFVRMSVIG